MLINTIADIALISMVFFIAGNILWQDHSKSRWLLNSQLKKEIVVGLLCGSLGLCLLLFSVGTVGEHPVSLRYLGIMIPVIFFGSRPTIVSFITIVMGSLFFVDKIDAVMIILIGNLVLTLIIGLVVNTEREKLVKRIFIQNTASLVLYFISIALIEKYLIPPFGFIVMERFLTTYLSFLLASTVSFLTCIYVAKYTKDKLELERQIRLSHERMEVLARVDALTGLANRGYYNEKMEEHWGLARRKAEPIALLMIDIDYFKKFNDSYGHLEGDECLIKVATALKEGVYRSTDVLARYGGEEFSVILPQTDEASALAVANRLCESVRLLNKEHAQSDHGIVTISVGVAAIVPRPEQDYMALIAKADAALYEAKRNGRNQSMLSK